MNTKAKLICATYALIALLALPATWINNIAQLQPEQTIAGEIPSRSIS